MSNPNNNSQPSSSDLETLAAEQRRELMAAKDLDFAYNLQLLEALTASLSLNPQPSTSSPPVLPPRENAANFTDLQYAELLKLEQEAKDQVISETEFRKLKSDLHRRIHDHRVAVEISEMDEYDWEDWGDNFEQPYVESGSSENEEVFRVYFKGLVEENLGNGKGLGGIGVAVCSSRDELLFELRKPFVVVGNGVGISRRTIEFRALIEGLNAALELDLKSVVFYCDYYSLYQLVTGRWSAKTRNISSLVNQVSGLREKFTSCEPYLVPRNDIKFAFKLAREAIVSQSSKAAGSSGSNISFETCAICLEDTNIGQIFSIDKCAHRYCYSCMKQHVEVKLLHGMLPTCPHEDCTTDLEIDSCSKFLTPRLIELMHHRLKEASIPVMEKVYCPYPKCSALMSRREILEYSKGAFVGAEKSGARKCIKCNGRFCIDCKVPWHNNMTCFDYKRKNPYPPAEEAKLKKLAITNLWRQCVKCSHMIELAAGCYHMTCRCGYEFCYTCGADWKDKKATCSCPLWDEQNIVDEDAEEDEEEDEEEEEVEEDYDSDESDYYFY